MNREITALDFLIFRASKGTIVKWRHNNNGIASFYGHEADHRALQYVKWLIKWLNNPDNAISKDKLLETIDKAHKEKS
jgi:hypothetical protein